MKVKIGGGERYPVYYLAEDVGVPSIEVDVPEKKVEEWKRVLEEFERVQDEMRSAVGE